MVTRMTCMTASCPNASNLNKLRLWWSEGVMCFLVSSSDCQPCKVLEILDEEDEQPKNGQSSQAITYQKALWS